MIYLCRRYILNCRRRLAPILLPILPSLKRRCLTLSDKIRRIVPAGWPPPTAEKGIVSGKRPARLNIKIPIDKQRLIVLISHRTLSFSAIAPIVQKGFHFAAQALGLAKRLRYSLRLAGTPVAWPPALFTGSRDRSPVAVTASGIFRGTGACAAAADWQTAP